ncbi:Hsp70 family protein [Mycobacteroides abscessus]|uniref:Hsp70 family protein n=1 Tax=Mycobacteroides abscessus TaxID=36809 RepID=UPI0009A61453|nr:Hsp70 family protein [Mycobacteroides abscessus]SKG49254.1 chaperone protein HscA [Mycobacteroides abscessus subsp. massiliense]SKH53236.1 chaperone protein HscA [Mycobacteroides abscessus subsp. massiliense]SKH96265.1 chaperone protein HscA [Mycobacteroides abscessus subsp. massiliense]SKI92580.1 chaperone protein HscA [Mycobacteroides abscessus subsp. massiliense]SKJ45938.1 chaperone protein HscA [Mycobacteroides abscessus subsp. massiliense]
MGGHAGALLGGDALRSHRVVVAVDLGTHASGFAWAVVDGRNESAAGRFVQQYTQWAGQPVPYPKTLTCLLLDQDNDNEVVEWGFEAEQRWQAMRSVGGNRFRLVRGFKMALAPDSGALQPSLALDDTRDDAHELITAYLRKIYCMAVEHVGKSGFEEADIRWCLTVPAIWDDYQKHVMRQAAQAAGFPSAEGRLMLALEPEAAAHYARIAGVKVIGDQDRQAPSLLSAGSRFVVADCGGGTIDLTAYRSEPDGEMAQLAQVCGSGCGSYYLNRAFEELVLVPRLGGADEYARLSRQCPQALEDLLDGWERAKVTIGTDRVDPVYLSLPVRLTRQMSHAALTALREVQIDGEDEAIVVTAAEIKAIFEKVVPQVLELLDQQLAEVRNEVGRDDGKEVVLLVGGFSKSPYLQERIAAHLAGRATVVLAPDPAAAVLIGAVHFAYDPQMRRRRTKYTYAKAIAVPFEHGRDKPEDLVTSWEGEQLCVNRLEVLVRAGDSIRTSEVVYCEGYPIHSDQSEVSVRLYRTRDREPRYQYDKGCELIGSITVSLASVMHLDISERGVRTELRFGETEIQATAALISTGQAQAVTLDFRQQ